MLPCLLSQHCLAGWETAQPSVVPSQPSVGLKAATGQEKVNQLLEQELASSWYILCQVLLSGIHLFSTQLMVNGTVGT